MEFFRILGYVVLGFIAFFSGMASIMFMIGGPTLLHVLTGVPTSLLILSGSIYGIQKIMESE